MTLSSIVKALVSAESLVITNSDVTAHLGRMLVEKVDQVKKQLHTRISHGNRG